MPNPPFSLADVHTERASVFCAPGVGEHLTGETPKVRVGHDNADFQTAIMSIARWNPRVGYNRKVKKR